jgi:Cu-processing system permease protein
LNLLLLLNPADAYRLINLTGDEAVAQVAGMGAPVAAGVPISALYAALAAWMVLPLAAAIVIFARRQP